MSADKTFMDSGHETVASQQPEAQDSKAQVLSENVAFVNDDYQFDPVVGQVAPQGAQYSLSESPSATTSDKSFVEDDAFVRHMLEVERTREHRKPLIESITEHGTAMDDFLEKIYGDCENSTAVETTSAATLPVAESSSFKICIRDSLRPSPSFLETIKPGTLMDDFLEWAQTSNIRKRKLEPEPKPESKPLQEAQEQTIRPWRGPYSGSSNDAGMSVTLHRPAVDRYGREWNDDTRSCRAREEEIERMAAQARLAKSSRSARRNSLQFVPIRGHVSSDPRSPTLVRLSQPEDYEGPLKDKGAEERGAGPIRTSYVHGAPLEAIREDEQVSDLAEESVTSSGSEYSSASWQPTGNTSLGSDTMNRTMLVEVSVAQSSPDPKKRSKIPMLKRVHRRMMSLKEKKTSLSPSGIPVHKPTVAATSDCTVTSTPTREPTTQNSFKSRIPLPVRRFSLGKEQKGEGESSKRLSKGSLKGVGASIFSKGKKMLRKLKRVVT